MSLEVHMIDPVQKENMLKQVNQKRSQSIKKLWENPKYRKKQSENNRIKAFY